MADQETIRFGVVVDTDRIRREAKEVEKIFEEIGETAEAQGKKVDSLFSGLGAGPRALQDIGRSGDGVFGGLSEKMRRLAVDIQEGMLTLSQLEKMQHALNASYEAGNVPLDTYLQTQARLSVLHGELSRSILDNDQVLRLSASSIGFAEGSIEGLRSKVVLLAAEYMRLSRTQREGTQGNALLSDLAEAQAELQAAAASVEQYGQSAGAGVRGLNEQIRRLVGELPSLFADPQQFLMNIAGSLPAFIGELANARKEFAAMEAAGKKGVPVWQQVASSLFSWQTALVGGIALLAAHGDRIVEWVGNLFSGKKALDAGAAALEMFHEVMARGEADAQAEIVKLDLLYDAATDASQAYDERRKAAEKLQEFYPYYFENMDTEQIMLGQAVGKYDDLREAIVRMAQAQAAYDEIVGIQRKKQAITSLDAYQPYKESYDLVKNGAKDEQTLQIQGGGSAMYPGKTVYFDENERRLRRMRDELIRQLKASGNDELVEALKSAGNEPEKLLEIYEKQNRLLQGMATVSLTDSATAGGNGGDAGVVQQAAQAEINAAKRTYDETTKLKRKQIKDRIKLIEFDRDQAIAAIEAEKEAYIGLQIEAGKAVRREDVDISAFDSRINAVREGARLDMEAERQENARNFQELLREFETYEQKRNRIQQKYADLRERMCEEDGNTLKGGVTPGNMAEIDRAETEELQDADLFFAQRNGAFIAWSDTLARQTSGQLQSMLAEARAVLSAMEADAGTDPEKLAAVRAAIVLIEETSSRMSEKMQEAAEESEDAWAGLYDILNDVSGLFSELGGTIGGVAGGILSDIGEVTSAALSMADAVKNIGKASEESEENTGKKQEAPFDLGTLGGMLPAISAGIKLVGVLMDVIKGNREANEAAVKATRKYDAFQEEQAREASLAKYDDNIFGEDRYGKFKKYGELSEDSLSEFAAGAAKFRKFSGTFGEEFAGIDGITSDMRSGWQKFWGSNKNQFTLRYEDLLDKEGNFDGENLIGWYDAYGSGLSSANKALVEEMIADWEDYEEAMEGMSEYLSGLFGNVAGTIADEMVDAFLRTGNAAVDLTDMVGDLARQMAKDLVSSFLIDHVFTEDIQEQIKNALLADDVGTAVDLFDGVLADAERMAPSITALLEEIGLGTDGFEVSPSREGIAQASQESVDELNGRFTAIQGHTASISSQVRTLALQSGQMLRHLAGIEVNTAELARLESMQADMHAMRSRIDDLSIKGINIQR